MKFLLWRCSIHAGDTFIRKPSAPRFGMRVGAVTAGIWLKIIWCLGVFGLQELGGSLKDISKACFTTHNLHGTCVLSIGPGHVRRPSSKASLASQINTASQPQMDTFTNISSLVGRASANRFAVVSDLVTMESRSVEVYSQVALSPGFGSQMTNLQLCCCQ